MGVQVRKTILLVDDEDDLRTTLAHRLSGEGYLVETAVDGEDAFDKLCLSVFDLVILDVMLPYRNGFDLCRDLRVAGVTTPILLLSVRNRTIDKVVGFRLGADDYVTKPFASEELVVRIEALLKMVSRPPSA
jgi:two-component system, OmpR family, alkaline phosphatase synthesis response regulator PhoP